MANDIDPKLVAVIGLGNMGSSLAEALLSAGFPVIVWNRSSHKSEAVREKGMEIANSVAQAVSTAKIVILCVSDHIATKEILFHDELGKMLEGKLLVQLSSINPDQSRETDAWAKDFAIGYIEGSILGLPTDIKENSAIVVYAGPQSAFEENEAVFLALGGNPKFVGETIGTAVTFDKIVYACGYGLAQVFMQGAALAHAKGVPIETYTETVMARFPAYGRNLTRISERIAARDHDDVECRLDIHAAAFEGTLTLCQETGVDSSLPQAMMHNFELAIENGHGARELSALFEILIPE
jgi:3-hydroxyisobutyrate dehydrogenase-like beta-hydroxyacid dehydrogenase